MSGAHAATIRVTAELHMYDAVIEADAILHPSAHDAVLWVTPGALRRLRLSPADLPVAEWIQ